MTEREAVKKQTPSEAQKSYGNYRKLHICCHGLRISIENPRGSLRSGTDSNGRKWSRKLQHDYGYFRETEGPDGDQVDVFLSPRYRTAKAVHIIDQLNPSTGKFDEHKVMLGFDTQEDAKKAYLSNYERGWRGMGDVTTLSIPAFKAWLYDEKRTQKPVSSIVKSAMLKQAFGLRGAAETGAYFIPGVGGVLSGRDALRSGGNIFKNLAQGRPGAALLSTGATLGNTLMALADFIPVLGPAARGKVNMLRGAAKGARGLLAARALKGLRAVDKVGDAAKLRRMGLQAAKLGQGGLNTSRVGRLIGRVADPFHGSKLRNLTKSIGSTNTPAELNRLFQEAARMRSTIPRSLNPFSAAARARKAYGSLRGSPKSIQAFQRGYAHPSRVFSRQLSPGVVHGALTRHLGDRMGYNTARRIARLSSRGPLSSYRGAQGLGFGLLMGSQTGMVPLQDQYDAKQMEAAKKWLGIG